MEWGWASWARLEGHRPKYKADYIKMFELLLPRCVHAADDQTYYWLSSPSSGGSFDDPNDWERGVRALLGCLAFRQAVHRVPQL